MAGPPRKTKEKTKSRLGEAVNFILPATRSDGDTYQGFIRLIHKGAVAFNGTLSAGFPIEEELTMCPHAARLAAALNMAGVDLVIAALPSGNLSVKGEKGFRALIPCHAGEMPPVGPDPNIAVIDDKLKEGFAVLHKLTREGAETMVEAAVLLQANSMVATNRYVMIEHWHGIDLPPDLVIPGFFCKAIADSAIPLTGFGYSDRSVTFWFENGAWMKTQRYTEPYPNYRRVIDKETYPVAVPEDFFKLVEKMRDLTDSNALFFDTGVIRTELSKETGAQTDCLGLELDETRSYSSVYLKAVKDVAEFMDLKTHKDGGFFFKGNFRAVVAAIR